MKKLRPNEWLPEELALQPGERVFGRHYEEWTPHASQKDLPPTVEAAEIKEGERDGEIAELELEEDEAEFSGEVQPSSPYRYQMPPKKAQKSTQRENRLRKLRQQYLAEHHGDEVADVIAQYYSRSVFNP